MLDSQAMRSIPVRLWLLSFASAILQLLPFPIADPAPLWRRAFCWFCLTPLLWALLSRTRTGAKLSPLQSAVLAYVCGVIWYFGNCYWIYRTMHVYESIPTAASLGILFLFSLYVGLYHALFGGLIGLLHRRASRHVVLCAVPFLWVAVELARARITGFPWDLLGYTQVDNLTLDRLAPWTGVMGLSFVIAMVNALWLMKSPVRDRRMTYAAIAVATVMTAALTWLNVRSQPAASEVAPEVATLVQVNLGVGKEEGKVETKQEMIAAFTQLSLRPKLSAGVPGSEQAPPPTQLIAWPESPAPFVESDQIFRHSLEELAVLAKAPVVANAITVGPVAADQHYSLYNSATFFLPDGTYAGHYDKMHLVPFGEYTPYKPLFFFVGHLLDDLNFIPGTQHKLLRYGGRQYGVFICYESIFGEDMRRFALDGAQVLVNISDDGWYGDTSAPWEHLDMVRMRAIENHRWILRATNTGVTAAVDPYGRVTATLPRHVRSSLDVMFAYEDGLTFYTQHGDWFAWLCAVVTMVLLLGGMLTRRRLMREAVN
jgi:apolipoprotein N-acyltransferase